MALGLSSICSISMETVQVAVTLAAVLVALFNPRAILRAQRKDRRSTERQQRRSVAISLSTDIARMEAELSSLNSALKLYRERNVNITDFVLASFNFEPQSIIDSPELWVYLMPTSIVKELAKLRMTISHYVGMIDRYGRVSPDSLQDARIYHDLIGFSQNAMDCCRSTLKALKKEYVDLQGIHEEAA